MDGAAGDLAIQNIEIDLRGPGRRWICLAGLQLISRRLGIRLDIAPVPDGDLIFGQQEFVRSSRARHAGDELPLLQSSNHLIGRRWHDAQCLCDLRFGRSLTISTDVLMNEGQVPALCGCKCWHRILNSAPLA